MKIKGHREDYHEEVKNRELTRDERWEVIVLRKKAEMSWSQIAAKTGFSISTCSRIYNYTISNLWYSIESKTLLRTCHAVFKLSLMLKVVRHHINC